MEEILHQLVKIFHYAQGFIHPRWLAGFLPSTLYQPQNSHFKQTTRVGRSSLERMLKDNQDPLALQRDDYLKFNQMSFAMAQIHRHVSQHFADEGLPLFSDIPKIHCWLHSVLASQFLNPRLTWLQRHQRTPCHYKDGDKMRIAVHLNFCKL